MIKYQTYSLNNLLLSPQVLEAYITNFWNDIFAPLTKIKTSKDSRGGSNLLPYTRRQGGLI